ncbi:retrovirus-related pol polyprotein from transposon TNT 1-94 [Tanacetum coccineum]
MSTSNNSNNSNQQTLADSGANARPPMLEKGKYIPWKSRFRRFLDNLLKEGERMWNSIQNGPYQRPMVPNPNSLTEQILEPLSKMTEVDACKTAQEMWERIKMLMCGSDITTHVRHSRLMDVFDKFAAKEGESLDSVYESKYVMVRQNQADKAVSYDVLYDSLVQFESHVLAFRAKKSAKNHDPLALIAHSNASSSHPHANSFYSPQSYYVTHPSSVVDYDENIKGSYKENVQCYNCNEKSHYARDCQKPKVHDAKYFREQMLLVMKNEARSHLNNEENDFILDTAYGEESLDELTASVMLMARLQPADGNTDTVPSYDKMVVSQVNDSSKAHEQVRHGKRKTIIQTTNDDQIDFSIIFDDLYVANNGDIVDLEEKLSSHERIIYKMGKSFQMIHMLGKKPNKVYDPFLKAGLGYQNPERLKKAIAAQPKMYDGDLLHYDKLIIDSPDSEGTSKDAEENRIK